MTGILGNEPAYVFIESADLKEVQRGDSCSLSHGASTENLFLKPALELLG